jgi:hypothetical protein
MRVLVLTVLMRVLTVLMRVLVLTVLTVLMRVPVAYPPDPEDKNSG